MYHCKLWLVMGVLLFGTWVRAETPPEWVLGHVAGGREDDAAQAIEVDGDGRRYITGYFSGRAQFGDSSLESAGGPDIFIRQSWRSGEPRWLLRAGGRKEDIGQDLALDPAGNLCVTGYFTDTATFQSTDGASRKVSGAGETIFVARYNQAGVLGWVHTGTGHGGINRGAGVAVQSDSGACYVTGVAQGSTTFSSSSGINREVPGPAYWHMFLVKYDARGNFRWGQTNQASPNSVAHKVAVDPSGVYVTGWFESTTTFRSRDGRRKTVTGLSKPVQTAPSYPGDAFVVKYDHQGNLQWINQIGGFKAVTTDIDASAGGRISVTGFIGNIDGTPSQRHTVVTSQPGGTAIDLGGGLYTSPNNAYQNRDVVLATYDRDGILLDAQRLGGEQEENGTGVVYDCQENLYVTGTFQDTFAIENQVLTGVEERNLFVLKYSDAGLVWAKQADGAGTANWQAGYPRLALTPWNAVLVAGGYEGSANFDGVARTSRGRNDLFIARLRQMPHSLSGCG